jgi:chemotaxis signal transduction protein
VTERRSNDGPKDLTGAGPDVAEVRGEADVERVLAERARRLARPFEEPERPAGDEVVVLVAGGERYAVDLVRVERVHPVDAVTPLPGLGPPWRGLVSLRGELLPALDLPSYFGWTPDPGPRPVVSCVVVVGGGLRVALVSEAPVALSVRSAGDLVTVLDVPTILADPALVVDD